MTFLAYLACAIFWFRLFSHAITWYRALKQHPAASVKTKKTSCRILIASAMDVILFRRLFKTNKVLWVASWIFHVCFLFIVLRHSWYVLDPVPAFIVFLQPAGIIAGYILPFSLLLIVALRLTGDRDRYVSRYNVFLIGILFIMSITGLLMRNFFQVDLIEVSDFISGIVTFHPKVMPDSVLFLIHFSVFLLLIPCIPFHLFTAPIVTVEAKRREEGLDLVLHEK